VCMCVGVCVCVCVCVCVVVVVCVCFVVCLCRIVHECSNVLHDDEYAKDNSIGAQLRSMTTSTPMTTDSDANQ
jgi:hypothetical protein